MKPATRILPINGGYPQPCPWCFNRSTLAMVTGDVRGVSCDRHEAKLKADHAKALRIVSRKR